MKLAAQRLGNTPTTAVDDCDDCMLGPLEVQVNSKIAHIDARGDALVEKFHSLVSSCSASGYSYTTPGPYGQALPTAAVTAAANTTNNATTMAWGPGQNHKPANSTAASGSRPASRDYVVQDGDTCDSIAAKNSVSMFSIIQANSNLDVWCRLLTPGKTISIPDKKCLLHKVSAGDTCQILGEQYGATERQIIDWNANINKKCTNLERWKSSYICVGL
ncbi:hypothetical protein KVR01_013683 [Diaporthe batatas]|uniref:uncharacterized protein n=1 Tax=Diaporthe batatas TaxID=748121 RepID=UPI001D05A4C2|nr:uncharacterized protein KVR01_013683 [Diaporthe batatas]KAG8156449.1 hypothetical protein KVR01_013683 [Diaporthe batatas]